MWFPLQQSHSWPSCQMKCLPQQFPSLTFIVTLLLCHLFQTEARMKLMMFLITRSGLLSHWGSGHSHSYLCCLCLSSPGHHPQSRIGKSNMPYFTGGWEYDKHIPLVFNTLYSTHKDLCVFRVFYSQLTKINGTFFVWVLEVNGVDQRYLVGWAEISKML